MRVKIMKGFQYQTFLNAGGKNSLRVNTRKHSTPGKGPHHPNVSQDDREPLNRKEAAEAEVQQQLQEIQKLTLIAPEKIAHLKNTAQDLDLLIHVIKWVKNAIDNKNFAAKIMHLLITFRNSAVDILKIINPSVELEDINAYMDRGITLDANAINMSIISQLHLRFALGKINNGQTIKTIVSDIQTSSYKSVHAGLVAGNYDKPQPPADIPLRNVI
jgi:hypothetical protein